MHPAQIKAELAVAGYKQVRLAAEFDLAAGTVSAVINGRSRSKQVEEKIAEITGRALVELWPQWYGEPALVLSDDERELVQAYRALSAKQRLRALDAILRGDIGGGQSVRADRSSHAALGDINIGDAALQGRKKK